MSQSSGYSERDANLLDEMVKVVESYKPGPAYETFEHVFGTWADEKAAGEAPAMPSSNTGP